MWGLYELSRRNEGTHRCSSIEVFRHYPIESKVRVLFFGNPVTCRNIIDNTIARDTRHGCLTSHAADPLSDNHRQLHFPVDHFRILWKENGFTRTDQRCGWRLQKAVRKLRWFCIVHFCVVVVIICPKADELIGIHQRWEPVNFIYPELALLLILFGIAEPVLNDEERFCCQEGQICVIFINEASFRWV